MTLSKIYPTNILTVIFQVNLGQPVSFGVFLHLYWNTTDGSRQCCAVTIFQIDIKIMISSKIQAWLELLFCITKRPIIIHHCQRRRVSIKDKKTMMRPLCTSVGSDAIGTHLHFLVQDKTTVPGPELAYHMALITWRVDQWFSHYNNIPACDRWTNSQKCYNCITVHSFVQ